MSLLRVDGCVCVLEDMVIVLGFGCGGSVVLVDFWGVDLGVVIVIKIEFCGFLDVCGWGVLLELVWEWLSGIGVFVMYEVLVWV